MADHEVTPADLHQRFADPNARKEDIAGGEHRAGSTTVARDDNSDGDSQKDSVTPDGEEPNEHEKATLHHIGERLPISAWLVAIVELCERFTYYGVQGLFQNYTQRPLDGSLGRGALGLYVTPRRNSIQNTS
jgi:proton-dependent oligopeptide transporter, POT family